MLNPAMAKPIVAALIRAVLGCAAAVLSFDALAAPATNLLYTFRGKADGGSPEGGVILGQGGVIYGTADRYGTNDSGTVFCLTPPVTAGGAWSFRVLYHFTGGADGGYPLGLVQDDAGDLFGYTLDGGIGSGTVFMLQKPATPGAGWRFHTIYQLQGGADGAAPSGIVLRADGSLMVAADRGGGRGQCRDPIVGSLVGCGVVLQLNRPARKGESWIETVLHRFSGGADGATPAGSPILLDGAYYGTTSEGGGGNCTQPGTATVAGCGAVYRLRQTQPGTWVEEVPYSFAGGASGWTPAGGLAADAQGNLYGAAAFGGLDGDAGYGNGLVYKLTPNPAGSFTQSVLHFFAGGNDGFDPDAGVVLDRKGRIYSTTYLGTSSHLGSVFVLTPPTISGGTWKETIRAEFSGDKGAYPTGQLALDKTNAIYGVALQGGRFNKGTVYRVTP